MKEFMMLFRFEPDFSYQPTKEELEEQEQQWGGWIGSLAAQGKFVSTHQLGFEAKTLSADLKVVENALPSNNQIAGGTMVVKAESIDEVLELAKDCPILKMNGTVEVRDIIPMN